MKEVRFKLAKRGSQMCFCFFQSVAEISREATALAQWRGTKVREGRRIEKRPPGKIAE